MRCWGQLPMESGYLEPEFEVVEFVEAYETFITFLGGFTCCSYRRLR
jgi:hypothetical protein